MKPTIRYRSVYTYERGNFTPYLKDRESAVSPLTLPRLSGHSVLTATLATAQFVGADQSGDRLLLDLTFPVKSRTAD